MDDAGFNPYASWLGIEPHECPPSYYRLLELAPFESRLEVIAQAAQSQVSFIESKTSGAYEVQARKLLAELTLARNCLLNPASRQAYDSSLRGRGGGGDARPPWPAPNLQPAANSPQSFYPQPVLPPAAAYQPVAPQPTPFEVSRPPLPAPEANVAAVSRPMLSAARGTAGIGLPSVRSSAAQSSHQASRKSKSASYPVFMLLSIVCGGITGISIALVIANSVNTSRQEQFQREADEQQEQAAAARAKRKAIIRPPASPSRSARD